MRNNSFVSAFMFATETQQTIGNSDWVAKLKVDPANHNNDASPRHIADKYDFIMLTQEVAKIMVHHATESLLEYFTS